MNLRITQFKNRKSPNGTIVDTTWGDFVKRLSTPNYTSEFMDEYFAMTNEERTDIKDVGAYIGGECKDGKRSKATVLSRCLLTIDADDATPTAIEDYEKNYEHVYFCHSTHSSTEEHPRLRWIFPLSRPVNAEEYRVLVSIAKHWVGEESIDESTDQPERLMFWPSLSLDADWIAKEGGNVVIDPDALLDGYEVPEPTTKEKAPAGQDDGPLIIPEGHRDNVLYQRACSQREYGLEHDEILAYLEILNEGHCVPPLPHADLERIARQACQHKRGQVLRPKERTADDDFEDLGEIIKNTDKRCIADVAYESMGELIARRPTRPDPIIENFLYPGLTLLIASPKFGKSWMCLDIGRAVSKGETFMGMQARELGVLYLAFEDADYSQAERLLTLDPDAFNSKNFIRLYKKSERDSIDDLYKDDDGEFPKLDDKRRFVQTLHALIQDIKETRGVTIGVVIFDVIGVIRGTRKPSKDVYKYDYDEISFLHKVALAEGISIIGVHHTNKSNSNDPFDRISGSNGVAAGADQVITLYREKRESAETFMNIDGRFFPSRTDVVRRDPATNRWEIIGSRDATEEERRRSEFYNDPIVRTVVRRIEEAEDLNGQDVPGEWLVSAKDFVGAVKQETGAILGAAAIVGKKVFALKDAFEEYECIQLESRRARSERRFYFHRMPEVDPT